jgi:protein-tyrosine-phosphatase
MKVCTVCHGNIARSQILHHYLAKCAGARSLNIELFSCGTAPVDAYPDVDRLLDEVRSELRRRGLKGPVKRDILNGEALQHLAGSDLILAADTDRRQEILARLGDQADSTKVMLFYEFIGEGRCDFTDTYDTDKGAQDPERFSRCFDELERIAQAVIEQIESNT